MTLADVLRELGLRAAPEGHEHVTHGWTGVDCPKCSPNWKHYRLGVHKATLAASCWVCGRMNTAAALAEASGVPYGEVRRLLSAVRGRPLKDGPAPRGTLKLPKGLGPLLPAHRRYLEGRGFDPDALARLWGLKGIGVAARLRWRVWIPAVLRGETVSWTTRSISDKDPRRRYVSARPDEERVSLKEVLYGGDFARAAVVVVEGPPSVWRIGPGAVATCGVGYSAAQALAVARFPLRVVCFDPEPAAQRRARALCRQLLAFPGRTVNLTLKGEDPAEAPESEIRWLREEFLWPLPDGKQLELRQNQRRSDNQRSPGVIHA